MGEGRRALLRNLALWLVATAIATGVTSVGVSIVTQRVADANAIVLGADDARGSAVTAVTATTIALDSSSSMPDASSSPGATVPTGGSPTPTTAAPAPAPISATLSSFGGVVDVACTGDAIALLSASPRDGYSMDIRDVGPDRVEVRFASSRDESRIRASCVGGIPVQEADDNGPAPAAPSTTSDSHGGDGSSSSGGGSGGGGGGSGGGPGPG